MKRFCPEDALEFFGKLKEDLLIVEGKKDVRSLNTLGLTNILAINGKPLITIVDRVVELKGIHGYPNIIILTDFDREGRRSASKLSVLLKAHKVNPNQRLRSRIMEFGFNCIEDITMDSITATREQTRMPKASRKN